MFPRLYDPISKIEKINLYNNIAEYCGMKGRLLADLRVFPSPRIEWDFEVLGGSESLAFRQEGRDKIQGYKFSIPNPRSYSFRTDQGPSEGISGISHKADFGDFSEASHRFNLYFPNLKFIQTISSVEKDMDIDSWFKNQGREFEFVLDEVWSVRIFTDRESLNWLKFENENIGCRLTTGVSFYQHTYDSENALSFDQLQSVQLEVFLERITHFSFLLSFANSGSVYPLYVEAELFPRDTSQNVITNCATAMTFVITPIEQIGVSWVSDQTDLAAYVKCLPALEKMRKFPYWDRTLDIVQIWYEKATLRSPWPIIANSIGAALERLSYTILVEDEKDSQKRRKNQLLFEYPNTEPGRKEWNLGKKPGQEPFTTTEKRTRLLLERIGLKSSLHPDVNEVGKFLEIRNSATHPVSNPIDPEEGSRLLSLAILWVEETLLWRLGYEGMYRDRQDPHRRGMLPRYDLLLRDPTW